jgi:hypothetical protein
VIRDASPAAAGITKRSFVRPRFDAKRMRAPSGEKAPDVSAAGLARDPEALTSVGWKGETSPSRRLEGRLDKPHDLL